MDLTLIKGLGPARREKLEAAGVRTVAGLARANTVSLAGKAGLSETIVSNFQDQARDIMSLHELAGAGEASVSLLVQADVRSLADMARADTNDLAEATGLDRDQVARWKLEAVPRAAVGKARDKVDEVRRRAQTELANARVVLREGIADARVKVGDRLVTEAKVLPIKARDNAEQVLERVKGNVVVLREKADTALVRIEGEITENIPIFKERAAAVAEAAEREVQEVRVRVQEIRDKRVLPEARKIREKVRGIFKRGDAREDTDGTSGTK